MVGSLLVLSWRFLVVVSVLGFRCGFNAWVCCWSRGLFLLMLSWLFFADVVAVFCCCCLDWSLVLLSFVGFCCCCRGWFLLLSRLVFVVVVAAGFCCYCRGGFLLILP